MLYSCDLRRMADSPRDGLRVCAAYRSFPVANPDHTTRSGYPSDLLISDIARVVAGSFHSGMRDDHGPGRQGEDILENFARSVSQIDNHVPGLHSPDHLFSFRGQPAFLKPMRRSADVVVEEVCWRYHPNAGVKEFIDVGEVPLQSVRPFDAQETRRHS